MFVVPWRNPPRGVRKNWAPSPDQQDCGRNQECPANQIWRDSVEPWQLAHQGAIQHAHLRVERHCYNHRQPAGNDHEPSLQVLFAP
jgi:hypothetical protein